MDHIPYINNNTKTTKYGMIIMMSSLAYYVIPNSDRHTDGRTDATKYIISLASRSIINIYYSRDIVWSILNMMENISMITILNICLDCMV